MGSQNVYMLRRHIAPDNRTREAERIYSVDKTDAATLIKDGYAVAADFSTLNNYESQIQRATEQYRSHVQRIEENKVASPLERQYRIKEAQTKLDDTVDTLRKGYQTELKALSIVAAQNAFKTDAATPEASAFVDGVMIQLKTLKPEAVAELIKAQLPALDGPTKTELLRRFDDIAKDSPKAFEALLPKLKSGTAALEYEILNRVKEDGAPDTSYRQLQMIHKTYQDGYLAPEVSAQFRSDREYSAAMAALKAGEEVNE